MAKTYREIRFNYGVTSESIDVRLVNETISRDDLNQIRQAVDGTRYEFWTGYKRRFRYVFTRSNDEVFDFFNDAYEAYRDGFSVTFSIEQDDGTYEDVDVIITRPRYRDDTIGTDGKAYESVEVELLEI